MGTNPQPLSKVATIGLGANLEDPASMLFRAVDTLACAPGMDFLAASSIYLTEPQGGPEQNWFHNAVALFTCHLTPHNLLQLLLETEAEMGRERLEYCGPRVIDLDFLAMEEVVIDEPPKLILPHPRLHQRLFVLAPLAEVNPRWRHPLLEQSALELQATISSEGQGLKKLEGKILQPGGMN